MTCSSSFPGEKPSVYQQQSSDILPGQRIPYHTHLHNMPPRLPLRKPLEALFKRNNATTLTSRRTLIAAPKPNSGPLMERRADRALPDMTPSKSWMITLPLFLTAMAASTLAIFNYQKQNSSVVTSTMYSLRTNPLAREILGDEVYFASKIPYIGGEINQLHGKIDVVYWVKGTRQQAKMRFKSFRKTRMGIVSFAGK